MGGRAAPCWLLDLSSDLRQDEVLDRTVENALGAFPGRDFAVAVFDEDEELGIVRTTFGEPRQASDFARVAVTLHFKGHLIGVLIALGAAPFTDSECELIEAFSEQASVALANAQMFEALLAGATQDALTGLANRREFDRVLAQEVERSKRYGEIFSLAYLDLDEFKELNDSRGHAAGDLLLRRTAGTIQEVCRSSDVAGRLGGDEFAMVLPETNQFEAAALCERLRAEIERISDVSVSWGVAEFPIHGSTAGNLVRAADAAMYVSKPAAR